MYIGKVSGLTGATVKAIRHYEAIGLIPAPERAGKYRVYQQQHVLLIGMIRRAQTLGFALSELKGLVAHKAEHGRFPLDIANDLINRKRDRLHAEMQDIIRQNDSLQVLQDELNRTYASMPAAECTTPGAGA